MTPLNALQVAYPRSRTGHRNYVPYFDPDLRTFNGR